MYKEKLHLFEVDTFVLPIEILHTKYRHHTPTPFRVNFVATFPTVVYEYEMTTKQKKVA